MRRHKPVVYAVSAHVFSEGFRGAQAPSVGKKGFEIR